VDNPQRCGTLCAAPHTAITPRFRAARPEKGMPWRRRMLLKEQFLTSIEGSKMPKLKTKSGAKKRFKVTATGKVVHAQQGKRHGMIKRTKKQIRNLRGTRIMFKTDGENIRKYFLPNA
jgi:large subunit ribosomal protein L35